MRPEERNKFIGIMSKFCCILLMIVGVIILIFTVVISLTSFKKLTKLTDHTYTVFIFFLSTSALCTIIAACLAIIGCVLKQCVKRTLRASESLIILALLLEGTTVVSMIFFTTNSNQPAIISTVNSIKRDTIVLLIFMMIAQNFVFTYLSFFVSCKLCSVHVKCCNFWRYILDDDDDDDDKAAGAGTPPPPTSTDTTSVRWAAPNK